MQTSLEELSSEGRAGSHYFINEDSEVKHIKSLEGKALQIARAMECKMQVCFCQFAELSFPCMTSSKRLVVHKGWTPVFTIKGGISEDYGKTTAPKPLVAL